jgi:8-oxo-dGTP pyrophosphatase MutT (NUDIX family)
MGTIKAAHLSTRLNTNTYQQIKNMKTAVVNRIINEKGEMLFLLRNTRPFGWGLVGGKKELTDEDALAACIRETEEESGIVLNPEQVVLIGEEKSMNDTPITVFETVLDYTPVVKINKREHLNHIWIKTHDCKYRRNYTKDIYCRSFAGKTLDFVDLGREYFIPAFLTRPFGQRPTEDE